MTVLDVGANVGYYTVLFSTLVGKDGCVLALEPAPHKFRLLKKNIEANSFSNVTALPQAVSDRAAHLSLVLSSVNFGQHHVRQIDDIHLQPPTQSVVVESITADDLVRRHKLRPDFVKMDLEGAECLAFKGMRKTLEDNYEVLILREFNPSALQRCGANPRDFLQIPRDRISGYWRFCKNVNFVKYLAMNC